MESTEIEQRWQQTGHGQGGGEVRSHLKMVFQESCLEIKSPTNLGYSQCSVLSPMVWGYDRLSGLMQGYTLEGTWDL